MKKTAFFLILLFGIFTLIKSQTVDSIKIEQTGELIKIHYKIINSTPNQVFKVTVFCSINGGLQSVLKSLSGDFGDNVVGGRSDYMVLWDVLKDVDEVKSVDFSVRAELLSGKPSGSETAKVKPLSKRRFHPFAIIDSKAALFGLRLGYMGSWGVSARIADGTYTGDTELGVIEEVGTPFTLYSLDLTKRLINSKKNQLHCMVGIAFGGRVGGGNRDRFKNYYAMYSGIDWGVLLDIGRLCISLEMTELMNFYTVPDAVFLGLGYRF